MSIFIDTGIFVAANNRKDENHIRAVELLRKVMKGEFGLALTSDYIFDEAVTLAMRRTKSKEISGGVGELILGSTAKQLPVFVKLIGVDKETFKEAGELFSGYEKLLSFTDCTSIALITNMHIDSIASFDSDFDGIVPRVY